MLAPKLRVPVVPVRLEGLDKVLHKSAKFATPGRARVKFGPAMHFRGDDYAAIAKESKKPCDGCRIKQSRSQNVLRRCPRRTRRSPRHQPAAAEPNALVMTAWNRALREENRALREEIFAGIHRFANQNDQRQESLRTAVTQHPRKHSRWSGSPSAFDADG